MATRAPQHRASQPCWLLELPNELLALVAEQCDEQALRAYYRTCGRVRPQAAPVLRRQLSLSIIGGPAVEEVFVFAKQESMVNERPYYILYKQGLATAPSPCGLHIWAWHGAAPPDHEPRWLIGDESSVGGKTGWWRALSPAPEPCGATAWQWYSDETGEWMDDPVLFHKGVATLDLRPAEALT